jgi:hypothetical protein
MIRIERNFNMKDIEDYINDTFNGWVEDIADTMFESGKIIVDLARAKTKAEGGFGNITWRLRASIGCVVVSNHQIQDKHVYFPSIGKGEEGRIKGIALAREVALLVDDGETYIILVAGEDYASILEDNRIDVVSGSWSKFDKQFRQLLNR